jgi:intergrase/recombinase
MLDVVRKMMQVLPRVMALVVRHAVLTGLRPNEACESVRLISLSTDKYYNPELQALEHYKFPQLFFRTTKKAFISYLSEDNLRPIANLGCKTPTPTWEAIRSTCKRRGINMDMRFCRKIHASWLHKYNITAEEIDFLQGRTSPSIFSRHYLSPNNTLRTRVLEAVGELQKQLNNLMV